MSLTEKTYTRFWQTMGERYGKRWLDDYGDKPTTAWRDSLSGFTPKDIRGAIDLLGSKEHLRQHPPTEPQFRELLRQASRANKNPVDDANHRRDYWRSTIISSCMHGLGYQDWFGFEQLVVDNQTLGAAMRELLNDVDELQSNTGQRTSGQHEMCDRRCHEITAAFRTLRLARAA